ncbi:nucleotidyltransferase family protein [Paracoccus chinensis]|uniref:Molybdenum cofactor cytidylyltransferase n=1 Tax=Paracoccus chinensis TaxID=525640 RepID=A0A1G9L3L8_9RHOB|nr:NTP transferase domain-containing protein [Paracoccus chinensis]SDL56570.1 molybdenum cofactor cytidylyltransferase [Paracoccus chinensis]
MTGGPTVGVLLAAGHSRRWGPDNKLLAPWNGQALVVRAGALLARAPVDLRAVVLRDKRIAALLPGLEPLAPEDEDQSASLRAAVAWAQGQGAARLLVLLGDMPALSDATVAALVEGCTADRPSAVLHPDGRPGAPACVPASAFAALSKLRGDQGAGVLLGNAVTIPAALAELVDVDRPQDLSAG